MASWPGLLGSRRWPLGIGVSDVRPAVALCQPGKGGKRRPIHASVSSHACFLRSFGHVQPRGDARRRSRCSRSRGHLGDARDRRRVPEPRDALQHRQGLRGDAAPGGEGVRSRADPLPGAAHGHHLEVPRDDHVPRRDGREVRPRPARGDQPRGDRRGRHALQPRRAGVHAADEDGGAARRAGRGRLRRGDRRLAAATRSAAGPRSGSSACGCPGIAGSRAASAPSCGTRSTRSSTPGQTMRSFPLSNWTEMDVWYYIRREGLPVVPLYYAAERPVGHAQRLS